MEQIKFCQSCSMPLDRPEMAGTEKDGTLNQEYCRYCYQGGNFTSPSMTLEEMKTLVENEMEKRHISADIIKRAVISLPYLKRWRSKTLEM